MKKFYALSLAAVAGLSIASAQQVQQVLNFENIPVKERTVTLDASMSLSSMKKVPFKALNIADLSGDYCSFCTPVFGDDAGVLNYAGVPTLEQYTDELYGISNLLAGYLGSETYEMAAYVEEHQFSDGTGYVMTIAGQGEFTLFDNNGESYKMWMTSYAASTGAFYRYTNDIMFIIADDGLYFPQYTLDEDDPEDTVFGIGWMNSQNRGSMVGNPKIVEPNGTMTGEETSDAQTWTDTEYPLYGIYDEGEIYVFGIGGDMPYPCVFTISGSSAVATDQVAAVLSYSDGSELEFYYTNSDSSNTLTGAYAVEGGKTVITIDGGWYITSTEGWAQAFYDSKLTFNYDLSGIEAVEVEESNTDAPAVYYNLQGIQIANPVAGQMYIVKQGNQVSKVIR